MLIIRRYLLTVLWSRLLTIAALVVVWIVVLLVWSSAITLIVMDWWRRAIALVVVLIWVRRVSLRRIWVMMLLPACLIPCAWCLTELLGRRTLVVALILAVVIVA
jgi:hypothetical protein